MKAFLFIQVIKWLAGILCLCAPKCGQFMKPHALVFAYLKKTIANASLSSNEKASDYNAMLVCVKPHAHKRINLNKRINDEEEAAVISSLISLLNPSRFRAVVPNLFGSRAKLLEIHGFAGRIVWYNKLIT